VKVLFGRTWQVIVQADSAYRREPGTLAQVHPFTDPQFRVDSVLIVVNLELLQRLSGLPVTAVDFEDDVDRIVADRHRDGDGSPEGVGYYRRRLLEEVDLNEIAVLSEEQRRARLERVVGRMVSREGPVLSTAVSGSNRKREASREALPSLYLPD
jgi:hypothetical protein